MLLTLQTHWTREDPSSFLPSTCYNRGMVTGRGCYDKGESTVYILNKISFGTGAVRTVCGNSEEHVSIFDDVKER